MDITNTDLKLLSLALDQAKRSHQLSRHGCVAVSNGKIISTGYNYVRSKSHDGFIRNGACSSHAEVTTLRNIAKKYSNENIKLNYDLNLIKVG